MPKKAIKIPIKRLKVNNYCPLKTTIIKVQIGLQLVIRALLTELVHFNPVRNNPCPSASPRIERRETFLR